MHVFGLTDIGQLRSQNQDAIFFHKTQIGPLPNLFIVADGMGGHKAGEIASTKAIEFLKKYICDFKVPEIVLPENYLDLLVTAVQDTNRKVCEMGENNPEMQGMGTTLTACVITDDKIMIAHVGDSRAYSFANGKLNQLTNDHSYVEQMVQSGQLTAAEALTHPKRNMLTRVLGMSESFEVDGLTLPLKGIESVLLCSDGLTNMLKDSLIESIVSGTDFVEHRTKFLIEEANSRGGHDNISAVLIDIRRQGEQT